MAQSSALDPVIRRVLDQPQDDQLAPDQKLVCIDPKTKEIIQKRFRFPFRKPLFYIVTHATRPENVVESITPVIPIKVDQGITIPLIVQYQVRCPKGNEEQIAKVLSNYDTPQESLHKCVEEIIYEYFMIDKDKDYDNSSEDIKHILSEVEKNINREVHNRIGLVFSAKVQLHHYEQVTPYVIHDLAIAVRTMDSDQESTLRLSIDLNISDRYIAALKYPKLPTIKDSIIEIVQEYCKNKLTTQSLFVDTNVNEKVLKELKDIINQLMINHGRSVTWLQVRVDKESFGIEPFLTLQLNIPRTPHLSTENIVIRNDLQLEVKDAGKYINVGKPKLKTWAQKTLEDLFERKLFEWTYLKFLLEFSQLKSEIEKEVQNAANNIGYEVRYLITEPNLKENRLLRADTYIWKYEDLPTAVPDVSVNLQVSTLFHIKDFEAIKNLLNRNMDVETAIRDFIGKLLVEQLHRTDPETVYMRFNIAGGENGRSLQEDLQDNIAQGLKKEYSAHVESVKIVPLDTKIITFFEELQYKLTSFEIQIIPKNQNDRPVNLKGTVSVVNPHQNGWLRLHRCDFKLEDIVNFVKETLHTELSTYSSDALISLTPEHRKKLEYVANEKVIIPVARQYGVVVLIQNFGPAPSQAEIAKAKLYEEREQTRIKLEQERIKTAMYQEGKKLEIIKYQADHIIYQLEEINKVILQLAGSTEEDDIKQREELVRQRDELTKSLPHPVRLDWEESNDHLTDPHTGLEKLRLADKANPGNIPYDSNLPNPLPLSKRLDHKESKKDS